MHRSKGGGDGADFRNATRSRQAHGPAGDISTGREEEAQGKSRSSCTGVDLSRVRNCRAIDTRSLDPSVFVRAVRAGAKNDNGGDSSVFTSFPP